MTSRADRGSMTVEVAFLLVLLVVPMFYLVGTVGRVQAGAYAVTAAAREAGRAFVTAEEVEAASARAQVAAGLVYGAHGFEAGAGTVQVTCADGACLAPARRCGWTPRCRWSCLSCPTSCAITCPPR